MGAPTVLIVDDHSGFRSLARALLEAEGFAVVGEAEDGTAALALTVEWAGGGHGGLAFADAAVGVAFLVGGMAVAEREARVALLFVATGAAWFLGTLAGSDVSTVASVGAALLYAHRGPFVH